MSRLAMKKRASRIAYARLRASSRRHERIRIVGYDEDGPILDIPDSFIYHPRTSASGALILPKEWED